LLSDRRQTVPEPVLTDPRYKRPAAAAHFTWRDVYAWARSLGVGPDNAMLRYFMAYLESLGYAPLNLAGEWARLFADRTDPLNQKVQVQFGEVLFKAIEPLLKDFVLTGVSHKGWQAVARTLGQHRYRHLVVLPLPTRNGSINDERRHFVSQPVLVVGLVYDRLEDAEAMYAAGSAEFRDGERIWVSIPPQIINGNRWRLEFATALEPFLTGQETIEDRLQAGLRPMFEKVWRLERECIASAPMDWAGPGVQRPGSSDYEPPTPLRSRDDVSGTPPCEEGHITPPQCEMI